MAFNFKTERSITAGKPYVPSKLNVNSKNGLYQGHVYDDKVDPFEKATISSIIKPADPFKQYKGEYEPVYTSSDIMDRKLTPYEGHPYDTYYEYAFPNDKDKKTEKPKPRQEEKPATPPPEPKKEEKPPPVQVVEAPFPYSAIKSVSRTLQIMTKNKIRPMPSTYTVTDGFD